jgi:hypothetical protein
MSGSRANAAAIQRRINVAQNSIAPPGTPRNNQGQQQQGQQNMRQSNGRQVQQQQQQKPMQNPKMSVSDAIGLLSLRLGRVETLMQQLPPLDQIGMNYGSESGDMVGENMRVVDEAVFTNIVSRLEKIESTPKQQIITQQVDPNLGKVEELSQSVEILKSEMVQVKNLLLSLQTFTMQTNQKLTEIVFNNTQETTNKQEVDNTQEQIDVSDDTELDTEQHEDNEILAENIDLRSFVQSSI